MKIAYQGEPGAFSEAAARRVDADADLVPCRSFEEVFDGERYAVGRLGRAVQPLRAGEEDSVELGGAPRHSFGTIPSPTRAQILITIASGRRSGEPY